MTINSVIDEALDLSVARALHRVDGQKWTGFPQPVFWCEWNHPNEGARSLASMMDDFERQNWARFIKPGSTCIDIGAHSGDTTIPMGLFCYDKDRGRRGTVYAVEPNPSLFGILNLNLKLNLHIADFHHVAAAITQYDIEKVELSDHGNGNCNGGIISSSFSGSLQQRLRNTAAVSYTASGLSLKTLISQMPDEEARNISFIKTDCEGYDKELLRGAKNELSQLKPALWVEWFAWFDRGDDEDLFNAIDEIGYSAFNPWTMEDLDVSGNRVPDILCFPKAS